MLNTDALISANAQRWAHMHVHAEWGAILDKVSERLVEAKTTYETVANKTSVPWWVIAVIHEREASQSWAANLANGDPWNRPTVHVPKGRGPFKSWVDAAIDALANCSPRAAAWHNWTIGGALTLLEEYNGLGYAARDLPSPYVWASTDQYASGKYIADGHFDPQAIDHQLGCAALLARMHLIDASVTQWSLGQTAA